MAFGSLNEAQADVLAEYVRGQMVTDLGAGDLVLTHQLLDLGAMSITAIDKESPIRSIDPRVVFVRAYLSDVVVMGRVFVSWPVVYGTGIHYAVRPCSHILYLGKNTDGTACAGVGFFEHVKQREILAYVPDRKNTLIIYGPNKVERPLRGEEKAGLNDETMLSYEEAEGL